MNSRALAVFLGMIVLVCGLSVTEAWAADPVFLQDGNGHWWDFDADGSVIDGSSTISEESDAFDGAMRLRVAGVNFPESVQRLDGRILTTGPVVLSGLNVMRRAFVPNAAGEGYACFLEYLENPTGTDISVTATVWGNLGSDNDTTITATSSGDTQFTTADRWVCSSDGPAAHDPALNFNYWGAGAAVTPSAADLPAGQVDYHVDFPVTVPAMSTVVLMHLCGRNADNAAAAANAAAIDALTPASVLMGLNANRAAVVNWNIPPDDLDVAPGMSFDSAGKQGGPFTPNSQNYTLANNGVAAIAWTASASEPWLTLSGLGGTIPAAGSTPVTVSHVPAQVQVLAPGDYSAVVTFTNVTSGAQFLRNVSLTVTPRLVVRCNGLFYDALGKLVFNGPVGGDFYPPGEQYEVKNTDDVAIAWTTTFPAWLNVGPSSSGTLNPGESVDVFIVRVPANINALPLGDHADVVRFNDVTHSTFVKVDVEAQVRDIVFVDAGASGDGSSWGSALGTIQAGIDTAALATPPSLVFVKTGVYAENIAMRADVEVFGGCAGTEADLVDRGTPIPMDGTVIDGSAAGTVVTYTGVTDAGLDGCQVSNGYADGSGGVLFDGVDHTNYLRLCAVMNNRSQRRAAGICALNSAEPVIYYTFVLGNASDDAAGREFGGGICCYESNPHIVQCSIFANAGRYGGGIGLVESSPDILNCLICANSATYFDGGAGGGGIFAHGNSSPIVTNCLIAGNYCVDWNAGALYCQGQSMPVLTNCTISSNSGNNGASGGIVINTGSNTTLINCIVEDLSGTALIEEDPRFGFPENESDFIVRNCLFAGNDAGDISDFTASVRTVYTGGDVIDASVDFAQDNVAGGPDPQFVPNLTGQWTSAPTYNPVTNRTTLTTSGSPFAVPLSVALVNADTSQCRLALVYSNTANTIDVVGDITTATGPHGYADNGDSFELLDFHLNGNSPCINVGDNTAPNLLDTDIDMATTRIREAVVDLGVYEALASTGATVVDVACVGAPVTNQTTVTFEVTFSRAVTGLDAGDFILNALDGQVGAAILSVTGGDYRWFVTVTCGSGNGALDLDLVDGDNSIIDVLGHALDGDFTTSTGYYVDYLAITMQPLGGNRQPGDSHTFTVAADNGTGTLHYQWMKDGIDIPGAPDDPVFTIAALTVADTGIYTCEVSDDHTSVLTSDATLHVFTGLPAAGTLGLALAAIVIALGGATRIRRRRHDFAR